LDIFTITIKSLSGNFSIVLLISVNFLMKVGKEREDKGFD
jgi:hypothetical protein